MRRSKCRVGRMRTSAMSGPNRKVEHVAKSGTHDKFVACEEPFNSANMSYLDFSSGEKRP